MVNLDSASETNIADIRFKPAHLHDFPIIVFKCNDVSGTSTTIRTWLSKTIDADFHDTLRLDDQALDSLPPRQQGQLILLECAATLGGRDENPISIFAIFIPKYDGIRWFWSLLSPSPLLVQLTEQKLIGPPTAVPTSSSRHGALYTFLATAFATATAFPHSPDFVAASQLLDLCPAICDPNTACHRIEASIYLWFNGETGTDLSDDRYILHLEPAERELVSLLEMGCAQYLLYKRMYFKKLAYDVVHDSEKVRLKKLRQQQDRQLEAMDQVIDTRVSTPTPSQLGDGSNIEDNLHDARARAARIGAKNKKEQVRTENAHIRLIEAERGWNYKKAKQLFVGWQILGFLDEARILRCAEQGGKREDESEECEEKKMIEQDEESGVEG